jgi:hypothetical protein
MPPLAPELRRDLDKAIVVARGLAEAGARAALDRLGAEEAEAPAGLAAEQRKLRTALRERAKALGGGARSVGVPLLVEEIAYEQWHRMLFARFLAENDLLLHPEGAPVSLTEVRELAAEENERDPWVLAARYAAAMLPGIFRADDPANQVAFASEDRSRLETVLEQLPAALFTADDALGWVYQFWQSERKDEVNKRGDKIGGSDLPSVTQLFTEHYMVRFLLENALGAWWAGRHPNSPLLREWEYLRFRDDGSPAAGTFEDWPARTAEITVMDPCCGSGHFLVAAADMLRKMRMEEEGLTPARAAAAVIRDNLFGLELDPRCLQLAAFNLALDAWKVGGYQPLPIPNLACSGIAIKGQRADWHRLADGDPNMASALDRLYDLFQDAPDLGSLIDPKSASGEGLWAVDVDALLSNLDRALQRETVGDPAAAVFGSAAAGTAKAAQLLAGRYWLVATNPPFLGLKKTGLILRDALASRFPTAKHDLATAMLQRWLRKDTVDAAYCFVSPQNWLFLKGYREFRASLVAGWWPSLLAILGLGAFPGSGAAVSLIAMTGRHTPEPDAYVLDLADEPTVQAKARGLQVQSPQWIQRGRLGEDEDLRLLPTTSSAPTTVLGRIASALAGQLAGDKLHFNREFWEVDQAGGRWELLQGPPADTTEYGGRSQMILWEQERGAMYRLAMSVRGRNHVAQNWLRGKPSWGKGGVVVGQVGRLSCTLYTGEIYEDASCAIVPFDPRHIPAVWAYCSSGEFERDVRRLDRKLAVTNATLTKVPFDLEHWSRVAADRYPDGLPKPGSEDPTQWLFKGDVLGSEAPLQVAVARLLGYRWPDQDADAIDELVDADGLVPLVSVSGERPAADRLRAFLTRECGDAWSPALLERLLTEAGSPGSTLETWLRDDFFPQHAKLFHQRPFIWHVWDGRRDGFSVLCHYHRLDRATLEKLTYTLLGDWIERQRAAGDEPGAEPRLAAALTLQEKLGLILKGEAPHDIYVRWKSLSEQPIGWEPDLDDGVRLNIRPFVTAGVLRSKVNVKWDTDRGKDPNGSERINGRNPSLAEKRAARAAAGRR